MEVAGRHGSVRRALLVAGAFVAAVALASGIGYLIADRDETPRPAAEADAPATDVLDAALAAHVNGDLASAADGYRRVLELEPNNQYAYFNLGLIDQTDGRTTEAEDNYRHALAIDPSYLPALFNLATLEAGTDPAEAERLYRQIIAASDTHAAAHFNLGLLLRDQGRTEEGNAEVARGVQLDASLAAREAAPVTAPSTPTSDGNPSG